MIQKPAAVVFDLGKVLLDFDYGRFASNLLQYCDLSREDLLKAVNQSPLLYRYETGLLSTPAFFEEVKLISRFCADFETFEQVFGDIFSPVPEMIELNARLRRSGYPTYIFSNTNEIAVRHIRNTYPFFAEFTDYIFSYEHRAMKPDASIYAVVERTSNVRGDGILYIDDRLENVEQGRTMGWQTIHHHRPEDTLPKLAHLLVA